MCTVGPGQGGGSTSTQGPSERELVSSQCLVAMAQGPQPLLPEATSPLPGGTGVRSWSWTVDSQRVATQYPLTVHSFPQLDLLEGCAGRTLEPNKRAVVNWGWWSQIMQLPAEGRLTRAALSCGQRGRPALPEAPGPLTWQSRESRVARVHKCLLRMG